MKIVIDIPKTVYRACKEKMDNGRGGLWLEAIIANGTPYEERPKGKWRSVGFEKGYAFCICSECGNTTRLYRDSKNEFCCIADIRNKVIACMYCGARMER